MKKLSAIYNYIENSTASILLGLLIIFPTLEIVWRVFFHSGIDGSSDYISHLVLWIAFAGGMITTKNGKHLSLTINLEKVNPKLKHNIHIAIALISSSLSFAFFWCSISMVFIGFDSSNTIGLFPIRSIISIIPIGYFIISMRFIFNNDNFSKQQRFLMLIASVVIGIIISASSITTIVNSLLPSLSFSLDFLSKMELLTTSISTVLILILLLSAFLGTPIFIVLGGLAYFLFIKSSGSLEVIPNEAYTMLISHSIPSIPLFTFAGFLLSESKSGERLVDLFKSLLGWMPGGMVIMAVLVCTFFTTFTGASGVTILALGGLLSFVLLKSGGYSEKFTYGILTSSGSIGLLFPPSLPIILYGVVAQINIKHMFIGGIIPGMILVGFTLIYGLFISVKNHTNKFSFNVNYALSSIKKSFWDILLPFIILIGYFGGITTIVETGAIACVYSIILTMVIHQDITPKKLPSVMLKSIPIVGGVLIILAQSRGLSYYIVDTEVPIMLTEWIKMSISSKYTFLLLLNLALLLTGCFMDIFSAIMVVVPLILPLGELFGIHPVHLGIIFLANLELGYLTPPVGLNLFLASYRFEQPLSRIYRDVVPFFIIRLIVVLLITYIPFLSICLL